MCNEVSRWSRMFVVSLVVLVAAAGPDVFHTVEGWGARAGSMFILAGSAPPPPGITGLTSCYNIHTSRSREIDPKKQRPRRVINNKRCRRRVCGEGCGVSEGEGVCGWLYPPPPTPTG